MKTINVLGAISAPSPVTHYNPQDFTVAYSTVSGIAITGAPFTVDNSECRVVYVKYKQNSTQMWQPPLVNGMDGISIDAASDVINVGGIDPPFASGDQYEVGLQYQTKGYSSTVDAKKVTVLNPDSEAYSYETVVDVTNEADASTDYYVSVDSAKSVIVQFEKVGGSDVIELSVHGTLQDDDTVASSCLYQNITRYGMDILTHTTTSGVYDNDCILKTQDGSSYKYLKLNIVSDLAGSDGDYKLFVKKTQ